MGSQEGGTLAGGPCAPVDTPLPANVHPGPPA
jgi:hypothetical protein